MHKALRIMVGKNKEKKTNNKKKKNKKKNNKRTPRCSDYDLQGAYMQKFSSKHHQTGFTAHQKDYVIWPTWVYPWNEKMRPHM